MSIQSEITRLSGNVTDAFTAITAKGVTVPSGSTSDDLYSLIMQISGSGTGAVSIIDTADSHGGTVRTITAHDISDTTATAADVLNSKYFYTAAGVKTQGTATGSNDFIAELERDNERLIFTDSYATVKAAILAGKNIILQAAWDEDYDLYAGFALFTEYVDEPFSYSGITFSEGIFYESYVWLPDSNWAFAAKNMVFGLVSGVETYYVDYDWYIYNTNDCTNFTDGEVASGDVYYDADGKHTGTAARRSSSDLTNNGATVTAPAGYYASNATKTIASGTEGTPTASKGTVSNHAVTVTPSVTNVAGYISGGTHTGTAVSVSASELVSGTLTVDSSGTKDVTNYASASVPSGTAGTPSATKGTVSNHSVSVTPSVTNTTGWITGSTKTGTAVTVSASELVSGSETKTSNGTYDVTNLSSLVVAVPIVTYYTGSTAPSSSLGSNGDIYLQIGS